MDRDSDTKLHVGKFYVYNCRGLKCVFLYIRAWQGLLLFPNANANANPNANADANANDVLFYFQCFQRGYYNHLSITNIIRSKPFIMTIFAILSCL